MVRAARLGYNKNFKILIENVVIVNFARPFHIAAQEGFLFTLLTFIS